MYVGRAGLTSSFLQSYALKIDQTKNAQVNLAFFLVALFIRGESRIDFVFPAKLRFENRSNKKTLK